MKIAKYLITLVVIFATSFLVSYVRLSMRSPANDEFVKLKNQQKADARERLSDLEKMVSPQSELMESQIAQLAKIFTTTSGEDPLVLNAVVQALREVLVFTKDYERTDQESVNVLDISVISTPEDLQRRQAVLESRIAAAEKQAYAVQQLPRRIRELLIERNVRRETIESTINGFNSTADLELKSQLYSADFQLTHQILNSLKQLQKEWAIGPMIHSSRHYSLTLMNNWLYTIKQWIR